MKNEEIFFINFLLEFFPSILKATGDDFVGTKRALTGSEERHGIIPLSTTLYVLVHIIESKLVDSLKETAEISLKMGCYLKSTKNLHSI